MARDIDIDQAIVCTSRITAESNVTWRSRLGSFLNPYAEVPRGISYDSFKFACA